MDTSATRNAEARVSAPRPRPWRVFTATLIGMTALSFLWALATPIGAAPDEPAHIVKAAAVAHGQLQGESVDGTTLVQVPEYTAYSHALTCYAFQPTVPASCADALPIPDEEIVDGTTTAGRYNPVYYALIGWPSLVFDDYAGIYAMRFVSGLLAAVFTALTALMMSTWRRPGLALAALFVTITPMQLFLGGAVNPNAVETTAVLAVFTAMVTIISSRGQNALVRSVIILVVAAFIAMNNRGLSPLWVATAVLVPLAFAGWPTVKELLRLTPVRWAVAGVAAGGALAVGWLLLSNSLGAAIDDPDAAQFPGQGSPAYTGFLWTIESTPDHLAQTIGLFGWMDIAAPVGTVMIWSTAILALVIVGLAAARGRALAHLATLVGLAVLLPAVIQAAYITGGGIIWQGRYSMPLFAVAIVAAAVVLAERIPSRSVTAARTWGILVVLLTVAQLHTFAVVLRRYVVGSDDGWVEFLTAPEWTPPGGTLVIVGLAVVLFTAAAWVFGRGVVRADAASVALHGVTGPAERP